MDTADLVHNGWGPEAILGERGVFIALDTELWDNHPTVHIVQLYMVYSEIVQCSLFAVHCTLKIALGNKVELKTLELFLSQVRFVIICLHHC